VNIKIMNKIYDKSNLTAVKLNDYFIPDPRKIVEESYGHIVRHSYSVSTACERNVDQFTIPEITSGELIKILK
jgi:hypothetical protein